MKMILWTTGMLFVMGIYWDQSLGITFLSPSYGGCMQLSHIEMPFPNCTHYCTQNGGQLFTGLSLAYNSSKFQSYLKNSSIGRFWIDDKNETSLSANSECSVLDIPKTAVKIRCTESEFCNCYYENSSFCLILTETTQHTLTTQISGTTDEMIGFDSPTSAPAKYTVTIIISVYAASVLFIIIGGIAVVKIRHRKLKTFELQDEEDYEYFYPPFDVSARRPPLCGQTLPRDFRTPSPIMFPGFPALADIPETSEAPEPDRPQRTPPLPIKCGPMDWSMNVPGRASIENCEPPPGRCASGENSRPPPALCASTDNCRPPPGLYTPLLNPKVDSSSLTMHSDETLQELVENPVYGGYCATTRV